MPDERQGNPEKQGLPGSESDQNNEEPSAGEDAKRKPAGSPSGGDDSTEGESGEGSQSTGHPDSAG
jgi:hypothetical protein